MRELKWVENKRWNSGLQKHVYSYLLPGHPSVTVFYAEDNWVVWNVFNEVGTAGSLQEAKDIVISKIVARRMAA